MKNARFLGTQPPAKTVDKARSLPTEFANVSLQDSHSTNRASAKKSHASFPTVPFALHLTPALNVSLPQ